MTYALSRLTPGTKPVGFFDGYRVDASPVARRNRYAFGCSLPCAVLVVAVTAFYELWSRNATAQVAIKGAVSLTILLASVMVLATRKVESLWVILAAGLLQLTAAAYGLVSKL